MIKIVRQYPGIHFRELLRASGLGYGTIEHHLALLERLGLLRAHRSGGFTRYYDSDVSNIDVELLYYLKQRTCREIIRNYPTSAGRYKGLIYIPRNRANDWQGSFNSISSAREIN